MQPSNEPSLGAGIMEALRRRALGRSTVGFDEFMAVALYEPTWGYYRKERPRIGYGPGADFLTATVSAPLFGQLVLAACAQILGPASLAGFEWVEIGSEPGGGVLGDGPHPFRASRRIRVGEPVSIEGPSIVFSNELFDAQPFRRFRFRAGFWRELGVVLGVDRLGETELEIPGPTPLGLPPAAQEGYVIDAPLAAGTLARELAAQPWSGLFLAFDYGKSWRELVTETPAGTARAYRGHEQSNDLLAFPGEQDLTCHVCWDWIEAELSSAGFDRVQLESQESFFVGHAGSFIAAFLASEGGRMSREKQSLVQLLHPAHMGQKFQSLWALRPGPP